MKFKEKASSVVLAAVLMAGSVMPVGALTKQSIVGANRYETAGKIADNLGNYSKAVLVNGDSIADGLSASGLAGKENAPILLVKKDSIPRETLKRLYGVKKVFIIGKEGAISSKVEKSLNKSGISTLRIGGDNRIKTSLAVADRLGGYSKAFVVNGTKGEADAMSAAAVAAREGAPIILTNGKSAPTSKISGIQYYVIGGSTVVSNGVQNAYGAIRLSGSNRYATNKVVVKKFYPNSSKYYFAKGDSLVDALAVSPLAKENGVVLVNERSDKSLLKDANTAVQVGGMSNSILNSIFNSNTPKPEENKPNTDDTQKPEENKPGTDDTQKPVTPKPDENKPVNPGPTPPSKPTEKVYDINSDEFQQIVRKEFYRLLDAYRASKGSSQTVHHWTCEESSLAKSKHMIENNYFGHAGGPGSQHLFGYAENIAGQWVSEDVTETEGKALANRLFNQWKNSTKGHNEMMLKDYYLITDEDYDIDGFSFYAKPSSYSESFGGHLKRTGKQIYMIKATYHHTGNGSLKVQN